MVPALVWCLAALVSASAGQPCTPERCPTTRVTPLLPDAVHSKDIRTGEVEIGIRLGQATYLTPSAAADPHVCYVPSRGGVDLLSVAGAARRCGGSLVLATDTSEKASPHGVAATGKALLRVNVTSTTIRVHLSHSAFHAFLSERITLVPLREMFISSTAYMAACGVHGDRCAVSTILYAEHRKLPAEDAWQILRRFVMFVCGGAGLCLSFWRPHVAAARVWYALVRLAMLHHAFSCPRDQTIADDVDSIIDPFSFRAGEGPLEYYQGALVTNFSVLAAAALLSLLVTLYHHHRHSDWSKALSLAGAGWVLIPGHMAAGSLMLCGVTCFINAEAIWRAVGLASCICVFFLAAWTHTVAKRLGLKRSLRTQTVHEYSPPSKLWELAVGRQQWGPIVPTPASLEFQAMFSHVYSSYTKPSREFLLIELLYSMAMAVLSGWAPDRDERCRMRAAFLAVLPLLWGCCIAAVRPYIALVDNCYEVFLAVLETALMVCMLLTLLVDNDPPEWRETGHVASVSGWLSVGIECCIVLKFLWDEWWFLAREYKLWQEHHRFPSGEYPTGICAFLADTVTGASPTAPCSAVCIRCSKHVEPTPRSADTVESPPASPPPSRREGLRGGKEVAASLHPLVAPVSGVPSPSSRPAHEYDGHLPSPVSLLTPCSAVSSTAATDVMSLPRKASRECPLSPPNRRASLSAYTTPLLNRPSSTSSSRSNLL